MLSLMQHHPHHVAVLPAPVAPSPTTHRMLVCGLASLLTVPLATIVELKLLVIIKARMLLSNSSIEATLFVIAAMTAAVLPFAIMRRKADAVEPPWSLVVGIAAPSVMGVLTAFLAFYLWLFGGPSVMPAQ